QHVTLFYQILVDYARQQADFPQAGTNRPGFLGGSSSACHVLHKCSLKSTDTLGAFEPVYLWTSSAIDIAIQSCCFYKYHRSFEIVGANCTFLTLNSSYEPRSLHSASTEAMLLSHGKF